MQIAFLGLGQMGLAVAKLLVERGHSLTVWNRTAAAAVPLTGVGAELASTPDGAVQSAHIVFTMLLNDQAVEDVLFTQRTIAAIPEGAIHVSLSTISVALADRLEAEHATHHQRFLSSPVFGRPSVAAEGKLWLAVAGPADTIAEALPVLESISRGNTIVGQRASQANAAKLAGNFLITSMIASLSEAFTVAESQSLDPAVFLDTVNAALFQSPFIANYGRMMIAPPQAPGATLKLGAKDTRLFREVAHSGNTPTPLADLYQNTFESAVAANLGEEDWAAGYFKHIRAQAE